MQGKPPPKQAAKGPPSSPSGMAPQSAPGQAPASPPGGLLGKAPPAGADLKRRGRGGAGVQLSDVGWGKIFTLGWKLLSFFKFLAIAYCLMMLVQNVVNLGMSQLIGEVTKALHAVANSATPQDSAAPANAVTTKPVAPKAVTPNGPSDTAVKQEDPKSRLLWVSLGWAICALVALGLGLPMRTISTKLDLALSNKLRSQLFARLLRQSPDFYHTHESGELNAIVNQFTVEASMTLRQVSVDMVLQMV